VIFYGLLIVGAWCALSLALCLFVAICGLLRDRRAGKEPHEAL
jgi:hypothetical protein